MRQLYSLLGVILFVAFCAHGCGKDAPVGPGTGGTDTTDTTRCDTCGTAGQDSLVKLPCGVATDNAVGDNGFILNGSGFTNQKITLSPSDVQDSRTVEHRYDDTTFIETEFYISNRVALAPGDSADFRLTMRIQGFELKTYRWDNGSVGGAGSTNITLEIAHRGRTRVFGSDGGQTNVTANSGKASPRGVYCGFLKEGSTGARMTITSGKFATDL